MDKVVTPDEFIYKNFNSDEIDIIRSDPRFFNIDKNEFKYVDIFKKKSLVDILNEEDEEHSHQNYIKNMKKSIKNSVGM
jgi:hypothetical protein